MNESALFGTFQEVEDIFHFGCLPNLSFHTLHLIGQEAFAHENLKGPMQLVDGFARESATAKTYEVKAAVCGRFASRHCVGKNVHVYLRTATHHCVAADTAELMDQHVGTEDGLVVDELSR